MATLRAGKIVEENPALADGIFRRGFGRLSGQRVHLHPLEAAYLVSIGKIKVVSGGRELSAQALLALAKERDTLAPEKYAVLADLRKRGYAVRIVEGERWLRVYERGKRPGEAPSKFLVRVVRGGERASVGEIVEEAEGAHNARKRLVWALVRPDGISYYGVERAGL
ncbi:MAG: tRNA-intron lyase [Candidatus Micrarchaeia archaeon]